MKTNSATVFEVIDLDEKEEVIQDRQEARQKFERGFEILEHKIITCRISRKTKVVIMITKSC